MWASDWFNLHHILQKFGRSLSSYWLWIWLPIADTPRSPSITKRCLVRLTRVCALAGGNWRVGMWLSWVLWFVWVILAVSESVLLVMSWMGHSWVGIAFFLLTFLADSGRRSAHLRPTAEGKTWLIGSVRVSPPAKLIGSLLKLVLWNVRSAPFWTLWNLFLKGKGKKRKYILDILK